jgi:membrane associated rhomboid family serine protease
VAAVWAIGIACALVEAVLAGADAGLWGSARWRALAYQNGGFWIGLLGNWRPNWPGQPAAMFLTYGFLHAGAGHLAVNLATLASLGPPLARRLGAGRFVLLWTLSTLGGAAVFAALSAAVQPMVGASGALFGLAGAWLQHEARTAPGSGRPRHWPVLRAVGLLVLLNVAMVWAMDGRLAWETHLGGFLAGWAAMAALDQRPARAKTRS